MTVPGIRTDGTFITWTMDLEAAEFYADMLGDYLSDHPKDVGVRGDHAALTDAVEMAKDGENW